MIRRMVEYFLGPLGMQVLAFYVEHSLPINAVIVLYGLVLTLAHINLRRIEAAAARMLLDEAGEPRTAGGGQIPWESVIRQASFFPLVARGTSLVPRRTRPASLETLCPVEALLGQLEDLRASSPDDHEASS